MTRSKDCDFSVIIVAAGRSSRFGGGVPKQFCDLGGRTVLERSIDAFSAASGVGELLVALAGCEFESERGIAVMSYPGVTSIVSGGESRAESVASALSKCKDAYKYCLVHDAARPAPSRRLIADVMDATRKHGAAVPLLPVADTVKRVDGDWVCETVDRGALRLAQTPQGARRDWLREALGQVLGRCETVTDEAAALEASGRPVYAVRGESGNRKITNSDDLEQARRALETGVSEMRVGNGFDIHRTDPDRPLFLGGVRFDEGPGLIGHSDADVVLHAAMDALLGAAGLGDIGVHFPPEDAQFAGADSALLARYVSALIAGEGYRLVNLDLTLLSERPKIRPRVAEMKARIAECFGTAPDRIGLKATTLERLGSLGRGEGMACEAVALLERGGTA